MPEVLTKHPDVVLQVLKDAGAQCGVGAEQRILTKCPRESFCSLPTGETCVYGLGDIARMTQISRKELAEIVCNPATGSSPLGPVPDVEAAPVLLALTVGIVAGILVGRRPFRRD